MGDVHTCGSVDTEGSQNVFVNNFAAHRETDSQSHGGVQHDHSPNVFVNKLGIARVGDFTLGEPPPPVMHGDNPQGTGSPNVFVNGG